MNGNVRVAKTIIILKDQRGTVLLPAVQYNSRENMRNEKRNQRGTVLLSAVLYT
jgi:hypothetical protein